MQDYNFYIRFLYILELPPSPNQRYLNIGILNTVTNTST